MSKTNSSKVSEPKIPNDLLKALSVSEAIKKKWKDLTPIARRDFISWIDGAKQTETRKRRIDRVPSMLASGKRRPCCFSIVPMNFYKALGTNAKAKAVWKDLSPTERRDYIQWVEETKQPNESKERIAKVIAKLAQGKRSSSTVL